MAHISCFAQPAGLWLEYALADAAACWRNVIAGELRKNSAVPGVLFVQVRMEDAALALVWRVVPHLVYPAGMTAVLAFPSGVAPTSS